MRTTAGVRQQREDGGGAPEYHPSRQLDHAPDWQDQAASAQKVRVAGTAFTLTMQNRAGSLQLDEKTLERLERRAGKALKAKLGSDYRIESLASTQRGIVVEVSADTSYARSRSLLFSSRDPWPAKVDSAMEGMRRAVQDVLRKDDVAIRLTASWEPGNGVFIEGIDLTEDAPLAAIQDTLRDLGDLKTRLEVTRVGILALVAVLLVLGAVFFFFFNDEFLMASYMIAYAIFALAVLPLVNGRLSTARNEIAELKERLELRGLLDEEERRAFRLFQLHNLDLKRYYDLALAQRRFIFGIGGFCIALGAGVAITALILLSESDTSGQEKILISGIGAVGAILANFVAVIYLRMFRDIVNSMNTFHNRLVATHHLLFGNLLAARIGDRARRDRTLAEMASSVAMHIDQVGTPVQSPGGDNSSGRSNGGA